MATVNYYEYIQSPEWRERATAAKARAGFRCQVCNRSSREVTLDAHHRTYERLGNERPEDLTVLCRDCHELYESQKRLPKPPYVSRSNTPLSTLPITSSVTPTVPSHFQPERQDAVAKAASDDDTDSDNVRARHMLIWLGGAVHMFGYAGNGLYLIAVEWALIAENPLNLINPLFHILTFWGIVLSPLFWIFAAIALVGAGLSISATWLVQMVRPRISVGRWFWRWRPALLVTAPIFLFAWFNGIYAALGLINTIVRVLMGVVDPSVVLLGSNLLRVYLALLPVPVLHLIWDNRFHKSWAKLLTTLVTIPLLFVAIMGYELLWSSVMCEVGLLQRTDCELLESVSSINKLTDAPVVVDELPTALVQTPEAAVPKVTRVSSPPSTATPDRFSSIAFCYEHELGRLSRKCTRHRTVFTGTVERIFATWTPSAKYRGASFLKVWYIDGNFIFESESTNEYAYIEVETRKSLKPGKYTVDIYVGDTMVASGDFEIR